MIGHVFAVPAPAFGGGLTGVQKEMKAADIVELFGMSLTLRAMPVKQAPVCIRFKPGLLLNQDSIMGTE